MSAVASMLAETLRDVDVERPSPEEVLERGLGERSGREVRIVALEQKPLDTYSSHPISGLDVTLAGGERLRAIFKRLRPAPGKAVHRELLVYERLLCGGRHGAPQLYATLCQPAAGRYWLFLEDVGKRRLDWCEADGWMTAFRAIARMHAAWYGREDELRALGCLGWHRTSFYAGLVGSARETIAARGEPEAMARFERLAGGLAPTIARLANRPRTLLHGDLSGHNVAVGRDRGPRPLDWEWAAIGPLAWDLDKLLAGWGSQKPRFISAYLAEFARCAAAPLERSQLERDLARCRVMRMLWYLRWWIDGCEQPAFVDDLLDRVERGCASDG